MAKPKPKLAPYDLRCEICWKLGKLAVFPTFELYLAHLKGHW